MSLESAPLRLKPLDIEGLPETIEVPAGGLSLGRDSDNDIPLDGERFPYTSTFHARIDWEDGRLVVERCVADDHDTADGGLLVGEGRSERGPDDAICRLRQSPDFVDAQVAPNF